MRATRTKARSTGHGQTERQRTAALKAQIIFKEIVEMAKKKRS